MRKLSRLVAVILNCGGKGFVAEDRAMKFMLREPAQIISNLLRANF